MTANYSTQFRSIKDEVSPEEWETRLNLAACYRLTDVYGMTDLIYNHITARRWMHWPAGRISCCHRKKSSRILQTSISREHVGLTVCWSGMRCSACSMLNPKTPGIRPTGTDPAICKPSTSTIVN